jgi:transcriptional regulator with XRE-family HTH domain
MISMQLSRLMLENNFSQSELSRISGVPQPTINRILNNVTREPRRTAIIKIAKVFGVTSESLFDTGTKQSYSTQSTDSVAEIYKCIKALSDSDRIDLLSKVNQSLSEVC